MRVQLTSSLSPFRGFFGNTVSRPFQRVIIQSIHASCFGNSKKE